MKPRSLKMFRKSDLKAVMGGRLCHSIFTVIVTSCESRWNKLPQIRTLWHYKMSVFGTSWSSSAGRIEQGVAKARLQ
jgi:hypothetical protein